MNPDNFKINSLAIGIRQIRQASHNISCRYRRIDIIDTKRAAMRHAFGQWIVPAVATVRFQINRIRTQMKVEQVATVPPTNFVIIFIGTFPNWKDGRWAGGIYLLVQLSGKPIKGRAGTGIKKQDFEMTIDCRFMADNFSNVSIRTNNYHTLHHAIVLEVEHFLARY